MANIFCLALFISCIVLHQTSATPVEQNIDVCSQPLRSGTCLADFKSFGYDSAQKKCVEFSYGGCDGNNNNFESLKDCQVACEACSQSIEVGYCRAQTTKYAYSSEEKKCVQFIYGGCGGNKNNFETMEACKAECV